MYIGISDNFELSKELLVANNLASFLDSAMAEQGGLLNINNGFFVDCCQEPDGKIHFNPPHGHFFLVPDVVDASKAVQPPGTLNTRTLWVLPAARHTDVELDCLRDPSVRRFSQSSS